jgi:hypothetical protein
MRKIIKWHADERVDLPDANQFAGELDLYEHARILRELVLPSGRNGGESATETRIFAGFNIQNVVGGTCDITRGTGIFKFLRNGDLVLGLVTGEMGEATQQIDLSGQANDDYAIYVRATWSETDQENRVHWDDTGDEEIVLFVKTREDLTWEWTYRSVGSAAPPSGGDWVKVWELTVSGAAITAQADYRHFFFEGDAAAGAGQWLDEWGTGTDRNADRASYGVTDFHQWAAAMRKKMDDIQGQYYDWWEAPAINFSDMDNEHWGNAKWGRHKNVTIGDALRWWRLQAENLTLDYQQASFRALDLDTAGCAVLVDDTGSDRTVSFSLVSRGLPTGTQSMQIDESVRLCFGFADADMEDKVTRVAADKIARRWTRQDETVPYELLHYAGSGYDATYRGLWLPAGANYHLASRTVEMIIPLTVMDGTTEWKLEGTDGDPYTNEVALVTATNNGDLFAFVHDFPDRCTLSEIQIEWYQSADGGARNMRLYAARVAHSFGTEGSAASPYHSRDQFNTSQNYKEYSWDAGLPYRIDYFDVTHNNLNLRRGIDEIQIGIYTGANVVNYKVFALRLKFTYAEANPFPSE